MTVRFHSGGGPAAAGAPIGSTPALPQWIVDFWIAMERGGPGDRLAAYERLRSSPAVSDSASRDAGRSALRSACGAGGAFELKAEAHLGVALLAMRAGDLDEARLAIWRATLLVRGETDTGQVLPVATDRAHAALVNRAAANIYHEAKLGGLGEQRIMIARFYTVTDAERRMENVPKTARSNPFDPKSRPAPAMGARVPAPEPPPALRAYRPVVIPNAPPTMDRGFVPAAGALELVHQAGNWAALYRQSELMAAYVKELAEFRRRRDTYPRPLLPDQVLGIWRKAEALARSSSHTDQRLGRFMLENFNFAFQYEAACVFWDRGVQ